MQRISQVHFAENVVAVAHFYSLGCGSLLQPWLQGISNKRATHPKANAAKQHQEIPEGNISTILFGRFFFSLGKAKNSIVKILKPWFNYTQDVQEHNLIRR